METQKKAVNSSQSSQSTSQHATANEKIGKAMKLVDEARQQKVADAKGEISDRVQELREQLSSYQHSLMEKINDTRSTMETRIKKHPLTYLLGAGVLGIVIGMLFGRRGSSK